jgi:hypothetical protein
VRVLSSTYGSGGVVEPVGEPGDGHPDGGPTPLGRPVLRTAMAGVIRANGATVAATLQHDRS